MAAPKTIVFGPTGAVGSAAARTAADLGAEVTLAMRDPEKAIPKLPYPIGHAKMYSYTKVKADLTDPASVASAVKESGAKRAFIYLVHMSPDHMASTITALKEAGIELVVFLSSFTVTGTGAELEKIQPQDVIDYLHARVEMNLEATFGRDNFVALRPGSFASNELQYAAAFAANQEEIKVTFPHSKIDNIVPEDIGRVGGTILAKGVPGDGNHSIYLFGPEFITPQESVATIARVLGRQPKIADCSEDEARKILIEERSYPPPLADYFIRQVSKAKGSEAENELFGRNVNPNDRQNVEKYGGGGKATTFEKWVVENKEKFLASS